MSEHQSVAENVETSCKRPFLGLSRNVFALGVVSFFTDFSTEMIYPLLPKFLTDTLGASVQFLGLVEGIAESTASTLKLFSGWLADRLGVRKPIALLGYTLSSVSKPLIALAAAPWHILVVRFADRTGKGIRTSPRDALIADSTEKSQRGRAFGWQRTVDHAGAITGPLVATGLLAWATGNYRFVFGLSAVPALLCILVMAVFVREVAPRTTERTAPPKLTLRPFARRFKAYLAIVLLFTLSNSSDAFILLRAGSLKVADPLIPMIWVLLHVLKMMTSLPAGILSDRLGRRQVIAAGWIVYALVYLGFAVASAPWHAWALFALYGLYFGCTEGVEKAFVADLVPEHLRGTAYGMFNFTIGIGALPASLIMGILWHRWSPGVAFGFGAVLALTASLLLWTLTKEKSIEYNSQ